MRKALSILVVFFSILLVVGCKDKKSETTKKEEEKTESVSEYKVEIKEENKKVNDKVSANITIVEVSNKDKKDESKSISNYLNDRVNTSYDDFKEIIKEEYNKKSIYAFDYKYSLVEQNNKYVIFKLKYVYQAGGPYTIDGTEYYMFDTNTGKIVSFKQLFSDEEKDKIYDYVLDYIKNIYNESEIEYDPDDYDLKDNMFNEGYFIYTDGNLVFSFPRSTFTAAAFGSIEIKIDKNIYK